MSEEYTEYIIKTGDATDMTYHSAKFISVGKLPDGPVPDFDTDFKGPIYVKYVESANNQDADEGPREEVSFEERKARGAFKRRRWRRHKDYVWKLYDSSKSDQTCYIGTEESSSLTASGTSGNPYVMLIPPTDKSGSFSMYKLSEMYNFEKEKNYTPLSKEKAEAMEAAKQTSNSSIYKKIMEKQRQAVEQERAKRDEAFIQDKGFQDTIGFREKSKKKNKDEFGEELEDEGEDVAEMAVDRLEKDDENLPDVDVHMEDDEEGVAEVKLQKEANAEGIEELKEAEEADVNNEESDVEGMVDEGDDNDLENESEDIVFAKFGDADEEEGDLEKMEEIKQAKMQILMSQKSGKEEETPNVPVAAKEFEQELTEEEKEKKLGRNRLMTTLLLDPSSSNKRKAEVSEGTSEKKKRVWTELEKNIAEIMKKNGGRMLTKKLVKASKKAGILKDNNEFKLALEQTCALDKDDKGNTFVVLKSEFK